MVKTLGIVEVQGHSHAMQSAAAVRSLEGRRFGGRSLLDWVVRRVTDAQLLDDVVVVCNRDPRSRGLSELTPPNVTVFSGFEPDSLSCFAAAVRRFGADAVVRVRVENPFVDPGLIDRLVTKANATPNCDYVSYCSGNGLPALQTKIGLFAEWCRADAIYYAERDALTATDRGDVTRYIVSHPELFNLRLIPLPTRLDRDDVRLSIHVEEDWEHAQAIYEALGPEELDWQKIAGLLDHQPAMRARMANLNRAESA